MRRVSTIRVECIIYALNGRMDKVIVVLGTVALATLALAIARQLSEKTC